MTNILQRAVELLERIRDTYLKNHQTERLTIDALVKEARGENGKEKPESVPEVDEIFEPLNTTKKKHKSKVK